MEEFFLNIMSSCQTVERELHLGFTWDALGLREAREREGESAIAKGFYEKQCLFHHEGCNFNCHVQDLTLYRPQKQQQ